MTITTKELATIADFEALRAGDYLAVEKHNGDLIIRRFECMDIEGSFYFDDCMYCINANSYLDKSSDARLVTLITSDVNGGL